ncbi:MAG: hypothetical protein ACRELA_02400 [Candidatus Rokuibacteriota bacterium]
MPRHLKVTAAQIGRTNEGTAREEIVERLLGLLEPSIPGHVERLAPRWRAGGADVEGMRCGRVPRLRNFRMFLKHGAKKR